MVSVTVDVEKFNVDISNLGEKMEQALRKELKNQLTEIQLQAQKTHRYQTRTGMLEKSVTTKVEDNGLVGEVGLDDSIADYGRYVVEGHGTWAPDPFLEEALEKREPFIQDAFEKAIKEVT
jgi:Bacteriophage protein of unknown function (DUF646).